MVFEYIIEKGANVPGLLWYGSICKLIMKVKLSPYEAVEAHRVADVEATTFSR
jgi:hypothetical protein